VAPPSEWSNFYSLPIYIPITVSRNQPELNLRSWFAYANVAPQNCWYYSPF